MMLRREWLRVKFGINFFPSFRSGDMSSQDYFAQVLRVSRHADELGYNSVKTVEHYFHDYGGHSTNPIITLAAVAAVTKRIRLITGAVLPAFNHPIKLAGELAMLDNISGGRLDAGFGRAFIPEEFAAFDVSMDESRARFDEGVEIVKRLWTEDQVTYHGQFHTLDEIHAMPRVVQRPHPAIWIAAVGSEESFINAARNGYHLMIVPYAGGMERTSQLVKLYREVWREAGHTSGAEKVQMSFHAYLAESRAAAIEGFRRPMTTYLEVFTEAVSSWKGLQSSNYAGYDKLVGSIASQTWQSNIEGRSVFVGTPDDVVDHVKYVVELFGEVEPSMQVTFGAITDAEALRTIELFAAHVMPRFPDPAPDPPLEASSDAATSAAPETSHAAAEVGATRGSTATA
jgi:natural product biosynthesis luciferase-like monooxygenase protein